MKSRRTLHRIGWNRAAMLAACGAVCGLVTSSCRGASEAATTAWDGTVRDSAGIAIIENFGKPLWPEGPGWKFTEDLRIGAVDGPPEYQFGRIAMFQVLSDGRIVVVDAMASNVRFFSRDGVHELTVGREGKGPYELSGSRHALLTGPGDTLVVGDPANSRMHVLAPDGTWVGTFPWRPEGEHDAGYWANDPLTGRLTTLHSPLRQADGTRMDTLEILLERDVHGGVVDTIARLPSHYTFYHGPPGTIRRYYNAAWWDRPWGNGVAIARTDRYRLFWYDREGSLRRIITLSREPLPMTDEERSVFFERWQEMLRDRWAEIKPNIHFADSYPPYRQFVPGPAGTLLVQRVRPVSELDAEEQAAIDLSQVYVPPGSSTWDVFDPEGRYLGGVVIPGTESVSNISLGSFFQDPSTGTWYLYSVWTDELDVPYIVRWRMTGRMLEDAT
jgi:hypothetical protein